MSFKFGLKTLLDRDIYQNYLARLDVRALLEHYNAQNCSEQMAPDGTIEILHSCLLDRVERHHTNGDANPSACVNLDKKVFCCYTMGFGCDLIHLVMKLEGQERFSDALGAVGGFMSGVSLADNSMRAQIDKLLDLPSAYALDLPSYSERVLDTWTTHHPYWSERGITPEAEAALRLGYDEHENRVVFPHMVDQKLVGWQKRVIPISPSWHGTDPQHPKYRNSTGFPKSETLYNLDSACQYERVCVVESPMSVARAVSLGIPNVVCTFGAKVSQAQIDLLKRFDTVYVWFDRDGAGLFGERRLVEGLYRHAKVEVITPDGGKDLGDCTLTEIAHKLEHTTPAALKLASYPRRKQWETRESQSAP